jgi:protein-L-isoaspartate O-methyltransferase
VTATNDSRDTSNVALAARYDEIPYAALPHAVTHPDRLATVATFLGMHPPDVAQCCVLEVGCNDGANLIPMAMSLPSAEFVGCDLSARALAAGRRTIAELGLSNITLVEEDLAVLSPSHGTFDYIVAHGVYSWVPAQIRDALFALVNARLSSNGVMFVSFNALPGCRVRQAAWEVLHAHVDRIDDPRMRLSEARKLARILADGGKAWYDADEAVRAEFRAIAERTDSALCHDDLAVPNDPFYFRDFVTHAGRFGLKYLAEADVHSMSAAGVSADARAFLATLDPLSREQYLDFVRLRRFRQSLLQKGESQSAITLHPKRIGEMHVSADPSLLRAAEAGKVGDLARALDPANGENGPVRMLLDALVQGSPGATRVENLRQRVGGLPRPLEAILTDAFVSAVVTLHVHPPSVSPTVTQRPVASPLARLQARGNDEVTTLLHMRARLPDIHARQLLTLLDGTRDRVALASAMNGPAFGHDLDKARAFVDYALEQFARLALLRS